MDSQLTVYDLPTYGHQSPAAGTGKIVLKDSDFDNEGVGYDAFCFAGVEDDLVIAGSEGNQLFIWYLPVTIKGQDCTVNQSLSVVAGHKKTVRCVRSNVDKSSLISCGDEGVVKIWTPRVST